MNVDFSRVRKKMPCCLIDPGAMCLRVAKTSQTKYPPTGDSPIPCGLSWHGEEGGQLGASVLSTVPCLSLGTWGNWVGIEWFPPLFLWTWPGAWAAGSPLWSAKPHPWLAPLTACYSEPNSLWQTCFGKMALVVMPKLARTTPTPALLGYLWPRPEGIARDGPVAHTHTNRNPGQGALGDSEFS